VRIPPQAAATTVHRDCPGRRELAMAGSEQRPTDDVLGHGAKRPEDETAGDRGKRNPDDTEGHMPLRRAVDTEDQVGDDTEGHGVKFRP
jgi:hypothetical protein